MNKERFDYLRNSMLKAHPGLWGNACVKQTVIAMIETEKGPIFGSNNVKNKFTTCPRDAKGFVSGQGYHLCIIDCNDGNTHMHAEVSAINNAKKAGVDLTDKVLYLIGHTYCCDNCINEMKKAGLRTVKILTDNYKVNTTIFF